jgi:preprotein translocase subunit SecD
MLTITVVAIVSTFIITVLGDARPVLGLDLQGGISIVLFPVKGQDLSTLGTATQIIRNRVDALGIAEPDVSQQGGTIVVNLPGVKDRCRAEALVGETAELRFREVKGELPWSNAPVTTPSSGSSTTTTIKGGKGAKTTTTTAPKTTTTKGKALATRRVNAQPIVAVKSAASTTTSSSTTTTPTTAPTAASASDCATTASTGTATSTPSSTTSTTLPAKTTTTKGKALATRRINVKTIAAVSLASGAGTTVAGSTPTSTPSGSTTPTTAPTQVSSCENGALVTSRDQDIATSEVVLPDKADKKGQHHVCYVLGPTLTTGRGISSASTTFDSSQGGWLVEVHFKNDDFLNKVAKTEVNKQVAIALDGTVESAPTINPGITGRNVQIQGSFTEGEASNLALQLRYGALPIQFDNNQQTVQSVSPTLGKDQLRAGIVAGLIGLALVALYMIFFYRLLGLVVWTGIALTGMVFFTFLTYMSKNHGLTLTLAGVTGIIVSVGVTVDSYVVFFERLKDEVRTGKTIRSSLETAWRRAWRTIVAADAVSLLGAAVLYLLAIGSVRGFALFLGISTVLDLLLAVTFMHPAVTVLARRPHLVRLPGFGIATGLDVPGVTA